jgi:hypothetical protein
MKLIPQDFVPYVATQEDLRCDDCGGHLAIAANYGIPPQGFCSCPFDDEHP